MYGFDLEKRCDFGNWGFVKFERDSDILRKILRADVANVSRNGPKNIPNAHMASQSNPHRLKLQTPKVKGSLILWLGIYNDHFVCLYFFDNNLTRSVYESHMLQGIVDDFTSSIPVTVLQEMWF